MTITATDGLNAESVTFQWQISGPQPPELPGDFDGTGTVDGGDYDVWHSHFGQNVTPYTLGDGNGDGLVDAADYTVWRDHLGQSTGGPGAGGASVLDEMPLVAEMSAAPPVSAVELPLSKPVADSATVDFAVPVELPRVASTVAPSQASLQAYFTSLESASFRSLRKIGSDIARHEYGGFSFAKTDLNLALTLRPNERIGTSLEYQPANLAAAAPANEAIDSCFALIGADDMQSSVRASRSIRNELRFAWHE